MAEDEPKKKKKKTEVVTEYIGSNPTTGKPYFRKVKRQVRSPDDPSNVPTMDELPLLDEEGKPIVTQDHFMDAVDSSSEDKKED